MKKLIRMIATILTIALITGSVGQVNVSAAESGTRPANKAVDLTGLTVTNLPVPVGGVPFTKGVTVTSAQGFSWDIPVIWADTSGKAVAVPEAGKRYFPTFALYVPGGYRISDVDALGHANVRFPAFLTAVAGADKFVYIVDPKTQITYITYAAGFVVGPPAVATSPEKTAEEEKKKDSDSDDDDDDKISEKVRMYCDDTAINTLDEEFLEWLIDLVKDVVHPQAVNLLREKFPLSFKKTSVENGDATENMGLYIYYKTGRVDGHDFEPGALAYVDGFYKDDGKFVMLMALDTSGFATFNKDKGKWEINADNQITLDNTIVHEMMHAMMDDYTRYGMAYWPDTEIRQHRFPNWFIEGIASSVENVYQFRYDMYKALGTTNQGVLTYTADSILATYNDEKTLYDLKNANSENKKTGENTASAYVMGNLATVYLGYLYAKNCFPGAKDPITKDATGKVTDVDFSAIRNGIDNILVDLHGEGAGGADDPTVKTFSQIISNASGGLYTDMADFQAKFIKGDGVTPDANSVQFCTDYLNYLESQSFEYEGETIVANGSILDDNQKYEDPVDRDKKETTDVYKIAEQRGFAETSSDDTRANLTAGTNTIGNGTHDYDDNSHTSEGQNPAEPIAVEQAQPEVTPEEPAPAEPAPADPAPADPASAEPAPADPVSEEPAAEEPAAEEPAAEEPAAEEPAAEEPATEEPAPEDPAEETSQEPAA